MKVWKLFFIYTRGKGKNPFFHFSDFPVFPKILKKEYNIEFKIYPSPFTSSPQHISIIVFSTDAKEVKEEYNIKVTDDPKVLEKEYQIVVIGTHHKMFDSIDMNNLIIDKGFICDIYGIHKPRN